MPLAMALARVHRANDDNVEVKGRERGGRETRRKKGVHNVVCPPLPTTVARLPSFKFHFTRRWLQKTDNPNTFRDNDGTMEDLEFLISSGWPDNEKSEFSIHHRFQHPPCFKEGCENAFSYIAAVSLQGSGGW